MTQGGGDQSAMAAVGKMRSEFDSKVGSLDAKVIALDKKMDKILDRLAECKLSQELSGLDKHFPPKQDSSNPKGKLSEAELMKLKQQEIDDQLKWMRGTGGKPNKPLFIEDDVANPSIDATDHTDTLNWNNGSDQNSFNLSIARPKLDFLVFSGDNPLGWIHQCEKYFLLANVPMDIWVSLATLHCHGVAERWRGLRTIAYLPWSVFSKLVLDRFSPVSNYSVVEQFHQTKQTTFVTDYINKFEEIMAVVQRVHPQMHESYYVMAFIDGLRDNIKHYLIPHSPVTLIDCYWRAKELEKGALDKKPFQQTSTRFTKFQSQPVATQGSKPNPSTPQATTHAQLPFRKEPGKCWGCGEPWTSQHKNVYKIKRAINAMALSPDAWLAAEQLMEEENSFQDALGEPMQEELMMISSHAAEVTATASTFSLLIYMGWQEGNSPS
jgi:hypothetical protein